MASLSDAGLPAGSERIRARARWRLVRNIVLPVLAVRVVMLAFGWLAVAVFGPGALGDGVLGIWNRWDGPHFLELAATGYGPPTDPARIVLFPLYPLTIDLASYLLPPLGSAMLISLLATIAAALGLYRLVRFDSSERLARMAVVALLVFPTSYAFVAPYSEALFLALAVWSFVAIRNDDPRMAGILGALAAATRIQGVFLLPALGLEYLIARRRLDKDVFWILFVGLGLAVYLAINQVYFGDPLHFVAVQQSTFYVHNTLPWVAVGNLINATAAHPADESWVTIYFAPLASLILLAGVTVWAAVSKHSRPSYAIYAAISLVSFATLSWPISIPRYILGVFPMFIALGSCFRSALGQAVLMASVMLLAVFSALFVIGHWAF